EPDKIPPGEQNIYRLLHLQGDLVYYNPIHFFTKWKKQHRENLVTLEQVTKNFNPDLIFVWGMWSMSKSLPALAEQLLPGRVVYFLSDYWPSATDMHTAYWQLPSQRSLMRLPKQILKNIAMSMLAGAGEPTMKFEHAICVSARVRELLVNAGQPLQQARVIHGGTDVSRFADIPRREFAAGQLKLLYAGQIVAHKGVHTAIKAVARLVNQHGINGVSLTVVGSGHPDYEASLRRLAAEENLNNHVTFYGPAAKEEMPALLRRFDVLVFPSVYEEPLARMTQEGMAAGLVVVGTTTGGTKEILTDGENGLTFTAEDDDHLARQLARLAADPDLCRRLSQAGRRSVFEYFNLDRMTDEIETYLQQVAARPAPNPAPAEQPAAALGERR
ncbi:MAG: glycosyltransferase family 4 protein, partial [Anaerolineae bacterium]